MTWNCPICASKAYQRYGGLRVPAEKTDGEEVTQVNIKVGRYFICRGCSVQFTNPTLFNANNINKDKD